MKVQRNERKPHYKSASLLDQQTAMLLEGGSRKFLMSARYMHLHSYNVPRHQDNGYMETKIGGHVLDHQRPFFLNWQQQIQGHFTMCMWGAMNSTFDKYVTGSESSKARTSLAYSASTPEALVYSPVKIGGHPLDHVPFRCRGLPSRPLLGYMPESAGQDRLLSSETSDISSIAAKHEIASYVSNSYDCSRCFMVRQSPRAQLCCGHPVCAKCIAACTMKHVEHSRTCYLECARCNDMVAIESVVFTNYILRMEPVPALETQENQAREMSLTSAWKQGGVVAVLSFIAVYYIHTSKRPSNALHTTLNAVEDAKRLMAEIRPDDADEVVVDEAAASWNNPAEATILNGDERWTKRVQGLQPPSKLLQFSFLRTLGIGNFAEVMLVKNRKGEFTVLKESDKLPEAANEISMLSRVQDLHVVQIQQYFVEEIGHRHFMYIEMEYCDGGDLRQMLEAKGRMDTNTFDVMFRQLCVGLKAIHRHGIVHRDLKPSNVLLTSNGTAKIADFGVSTHLESDRLTHHAAGTLAFMAPEARRYFFGEVVSYDYKADIWSLGALAVAMLTGNPEPRVATRPVDELVEKLKARSLDGKYIVLIEGMLTIHPADRISLETLLEALPMYSRL